MRSGVIQRTFAGGDQRCDQSPFQIFRPEMTAKWEADAVKGEDNVS